MSEAVADGARPVTYTCWALPEATNVGVAADAPMAVIKAATIAMVVTAANARAARTVDRVAIPRPVFRLPIGARVPNFSVV